MNSNCSPSTDRSETGRIYSSVIKPIDKLFASKTVDFKNEVEALWNQVDQENVKAFADIEGLREKFLRHHGFGMPDVDYTQALRLDVF